MNFITVISPRIIQARTNARTPHILSHTHVVMKR